ncbi:ascorbate transporter, chloroplastic-like [Bidens hawaiensis]|uniref:ascorbate transporter, chloroplastic-like n=1 Tax=Bidens hawaiensis TaxID=980011 RepID=UPI00404B24BB
MAIGAVISFRNLTSFISTSGKIYQPEQVSPHQRAETLSFSSAQYAHRNTYFENMYSLKKIYVVSGYWNTMSSHGHYPVTGNMLRSRAMILYDRENKRFHMTNHRQRAKGICRCSLSLPSESNNWTKPRQLKNSISNNQPHVSSEGGASEVVLIGETKPWWEQFPKRLVIVLLCFSAFLLCNMDRVNMSIAILPMSKEFNWNSATVGLIQSSFFWGYLLTQIVGGIWADRIGGKQVLGFGVVWWSTATVLTPIAAKIGLPFLLVMRAFMGIGEGVAMPAMNNILSKWIPVSERSRSLALVYSGMYLGSVVGLAFSPILIQKFAWPSVFYSFGSLGSLWFALWLTKAHSSPIEDPELSAEEKEYILGGSVSKEPVASIPWKLILSKAPVWALIVSHFCHNWGTFILLTWMPTYYNQVLKFNLTESGLLCVLPWLTMAVFANIGGWIADTLVSRGLSITTVRKIMQSIGFLGPAFFLTQLSRVKTPAMAVLCMACSQGSDAFSQSGLYSNHQDIGPRYAGVLLGLSNTAGVLAGVFGTAATGYILQNGSWDDVFKVAVVLYIVGTLVWNLFSTGEKILD